MGCDIHEMIEVESTYRWLNAGDPNSDRNYTIFSVLADVRNSDGVPFISSPRGVPENCSQEFEALVEYWGADAHSLSWVTLEEMKAYDINQKYTSTRVITGKDSDGKITGTCAWTKDKHLGPIGETTIFGVWGPHSWNNLIAKMEKASEGRPTRLCFFFDN